MALDRREQILTRLEDILTNEVGALFFERNRDKMPSDKRPAIILLDGDEGADEGTYGQGRGPTQPAIVSMTPEIYIAIGTTGPRKENNELGQRLNAFRMTVLKQILHSADLLSIVGTSGYIRYQGLLTDLARNRPMEGEMGISIAFGYILKPSEL